MSPPRVAMFVLNSCASDARVRKEAASLVAAGYDVRVFARADPRWPAGVFDEPEGFSIERLTILSLYERVVRRLRRSKPLQPLTTEAREPGDEAPAPAKAVAWSARRVIRALLLPVYRPSVFAAFWRRSAAAAQAWRPDVVHAHDLNTMPGAARVARARRIPLVYDTHELWRRRNRHDQLRPLGRAVDAVQERRLIRRADLVVTVSDSIADWLAARYRLARQPLVVRNVPRRAAAPRGAPSLRALAGAEPGQRILLYTGRATSGRGLEEAVDALPALPDDLLLVLLGYGDATYAASLEARARQRGVAGRVRKVRAVAPHEVPGVAAEADAALVVIQPVCLSYRYALPNKLFEAIHAGLPVLASDLPDMGRVVRAYGCGELVDTTDPAAFAAALAKLLADPAPYRDGARRAAAELDWDHEAAALVRHYRELLTNTEHRARGPQWKR